MKRVLCVILSVFLIAGATGCGRLSEDDSRVNMVTSQGEVYLSRAENSSVYGVETPDSDEDMVLDPVSQPEDQVKSEQAEQSSSAASAVQESSPAHTPTNEMAASSAPQQTASAEQSNPSSQATASSAQTAAGAPSASSQAQEEKTAHTEVLSSRPVSGEVRGIWLSYINLDPMIKGKSKAQFTANIDEAFGRIADFGFNTVFAQVRPFGDALYDSDYFPWSMYLSGTEGKNPGYDPLEIMCTLADRHGLRIEAWLNPYRVRTGSQPMSSDNQARKWLASGNDGALKWNGGVYYNPGSENARRLIVNGVKEIVTKYDIDGIHFDDYFYPTTDMAFDRATYRASGSSLSQADWRRENVNMLVREVYAAIKAIDPTCVFGISPQGNTKNNYDGQFADCAKWLSNKGYVDYICPQIYYGFENSAYPYSKTVEQWNRMIKVSGIDLYVGIAAYKVGQKDEWAGAGKNEWLNTQDILADMVLEARDASRYGGVAIYSYDSLFSQNTAQIRTEKANLKKLF